MIRTKSIAFHTLGCKLNYSETSSLQRQFEAEGFNVSSFEDPCDVYVINTCSVTEFADKKCRAVVRKVKSNAPDSKVVMIGCYAQLKPKEISEIPGVDMVLGAQEKFNLLRHVKNLNETRSCTVLSTEIADVNVFESAYSHGDRTRSFLKIQDGCNYKCSFCTIPLARGASRSDQLSNVVNNALEIAALGVNEIVLTGVNIGDYFDQNGKRFIDVIKALDRQQGVSRYRISSIEPNLCSNEVIEFVANSKHFMPHFHMPLQSGCDRILKQMRRRYKRELYKDRVEKIKSLMPHACIGVDLIVGFPGETEEDFIESYNFVNSLDISYLHVFTYSERANTVAPNIEHAVPMNIRRERNKMLRILSEKKLRAFYNTQLNSRWRVLIEKDKLGNTTGFTDNYIKVVIPDHVTDQTNHFLEVHLDRLTEQGKVEASVVN